MNLFTTPPPTGCTCPAGLPELAGRMLAQVDPGPCPHHAPEAVAAQQVVAEVAEILRRDDSTARAVERLRARDAAEAAADTEQQREQDLDALAERDPLHAAVIRLLGAPVPNASPLGQSPHHYGLDGDDGPAAA